MLEKDKRLELPPRARRIPCLVTGGFGFLGTTSACAENTLARRPILLRPWNYLRVRGEYCVPQGYPNRLGGTTSACAENTYLRIRGEYAGSNYLRVRGEYRSVTWFPCRAVELPPRARRIHPNQPRRGKIPGTTSACAENTGVLRNPRPRPRNYLRVRGEYGLGVDEPQGGKELPPRARRIQRFGWS